MSNKYINEINKKQSEHWSQRLTEQDAKLFCMIGVKENGLQVVMCHEVFTEESLAAHLEGLAKAIRTQNILKN